MSKKAEKIDKACISLFETMRTIAGLDKTNSILRTQLGNDGLTQRRELEAISAMDITGWDEPKLITTIETLKVKNMSVIANASIIGTMQSQIEQRLETLRAEQKEAFQRSLAGTALDILVHGPLLVDDVTNHNWPTLEPGIIRMRAEDIENNYSLIFPSYGIVGWVKNSDERFSGSRQLVIPLLDSSAIPTVSITAAGSR